MKKISILLTMMLGMGVAIAQPTTNAPVPTKAAADVIAVYSDTYTSVGTNYNPFWGQTGSVNTTYEAVPASGNFVMLYSNFNYQGTEMSTQNAAAMEFLHVDVWSNTPGAVLKVSPINNGTGAGEFLVDVPLVAGAWNSVDLPKSAFTGMTWDSVFQMKFDGQAGTTPSNVYLDNIYFWKAPINPAADATLSALMVNGTAVPNFSSAIYTYNMEFPQGTTAIPQITSATTTNASATHVITQATAIPGTATVQVTSQDASTMKTYTVNYVVSGPSGPAPTPPNTWTPSNAIALFTNNTTYTIATVDAWSAVWDDSSISDVQVGTDDVKKVVFTNFLGIDFSGANNHLDLTTYTNFHMDVWIDGNVDLVGKVFNLKLSQWGGTNGEVSALQLPLNTGTTPALVKGQWMSIDVPMTDWSNSANRNDIAQMIITSNLPAVYFDNVYFYKSTLGTNESVRKETIKLYPNPVKAGETIFVDKEVRSIEVYNTSGQRVIAAEQNQVSTEGLVKGVYILKGTNEKGETSSAKFIVK